jgi:hypothetical protein
MIDNLNTKGVNTATSANKLTAIFKRLQERQDAMQKTTWGKVKDTITNAWGSVKNFFGFKGVEGFRNFNSGQRMKGSAFSKSKMQQLLKKSKFSMSTPSQLSPVSSVSPDYPLSSTQGVGEIITICVIVGIALIAGAGTTALVLIKPWKNQSNIDLKESKELKELLENADPVVAQKIREDIKSQLVDAYTTGNRQGSVSSFLSIGKYVLIAGAALWLAPKLMDYLGKKK